MEKDITCIICPLGCRISVTYTHGTIHEIEGCQCKKGNEYAIGELLYPVRTLTSTINVANGTIPLVSIKTARPKPKEQLFEVMDAISEIEVRAPIQIGDVLIEDVLELDVDIVATKNVKKI